MRRRRPKTGRGRWGHLPRLTFAKILAWADAFHERTGRWPSAHLGPVVEAPDEDWKNIHQSLQRGLRGLPSRTTLACFLEERRGKEHNLHLPFLSQKQILAWADAHFNLTGQWPQSSLGPIAGTARETWHGVDAALRTGLRGLRGGSSLPLLLQAKHGGVRNASNLPRLTERKVVSWADDHYRRTGLWPVVASGPVVGHRAKSGRP